MNKVKAQSGQEPSMSQSPTSSNGTSRTHLDFFDQITEEGEEHVPASYNNRTISMNIGPDLS